MAGDTKLTKALMFYYLKTRCFVNTYFTNVHSNKTNTLFALESHAKRLITKECKVIHIHLNFILKLVVRYCLKTTSQNTCNFIVIYECVSSLSSVFRVCILSLDFRLL